MLSLPRLIRSIAVYVRAAVRSCAHVRISCPRVGGVRTVRMASLPVDLLNDAEISTITLDQLDDLDKDKEFWIIRAPRDVWF